VSDAQTRQLAGITAVGAVVLLALAVPAFWPDYLAKVSLVDGYTHGHAILGLLWLLLLILQPLVLRAGRMSLHRSLGRLGALVALAFTVSSVLLTHHRASRMPDEAFASFGAGFYLPLVMTLVFAAAATLGLRWRRVATLHARFMACTVLALVDPVSARLLHFYAPPLPAGFLYQLPAFTLIIVTLAMLYFTLPPNARARRVFGTFAVTVAVFLLLYFATPYSAGWLGVLEWFRALPLT